MRGETQVKAITPLSAHVKPSATQKASTNLVEDLVRYEENAVKAGGLRITVDEFAKILGWPGAKRRAKHSMIGACDEGSKTFGRFRQ